MNLKRKEITNHTFQFYLKHKKMTKKFGGCEKSCNFALPKQKIRLGKMITESSIPEEGKEIFDMMTHTRENERSY